MVSFISNWRSQWRFDFFLNFHVLFEHLFAFFGFYEFPIYFYKALKFSIGLKEIKWLINTWGQWLFFWFKFPFVFLNNFLDISLLLFLYFLLLFEILDDLLGFATFCRNLLYLNPGWTLWLIQWLWGYLRGKELIKASVILLNNSFHYLWGGLMLHFNLSLFLGARKALISAISSSNIFQASNLIFHISILSSFQRFYVKWVELFVWHVIKVDWWVSTICLLDQRLDVFSIGSFSTVGDLWLAMLAWESFRDQLSCS